jgi:hypothetical protein
MVVVTSSGGRGQRCCTVDGASGGAKAGLRTLMSSARGERFRRAVLRTCCGYSDLARACACDDQFTPSGVARTAHWLVIRTPGVRILCSGFPSGVNLCASFRVHEEVSPSRCLRSLSTWRLPNTLIRAAWCARRTSLLHCPPKFVAGKLVLVGPCVCVCVATMRVCSSRRFNQNAHAHTPTTLAIG